MKKLIALALSFLCLFSTLPVGVFTFGVNAEGVSGKSGGTAWQYDNGTLTVKPAEGVVNAAMPDYYYESQIPWLQYVSKITSIKVEEGVINIGTNAFEYTNVKTLSLPNTLINIGGGAFKGCSSLQTVVIPDSVEAIGYDAFFQCTEISSINIPKKLKEIPNQFLSFNNKLTEITIPNGVERIGASAFNSCALKTVILPDSVVVIDDNAFSRCEELESINLDNVAELGSKAFYNCKKLEEVKLSKSLVAIENGTFSNCESLQSITFSEGLKFIGDDAFYSCTSLKKVKIPSTVVSIGSSAFSSLDEISVAKGEGRYRVSDNCLINKSDKKLVLGAKNSVIPSDGSVTAIGENAFAYSDIAEITIPKSVKRIERSAFEDCEKLERVTVNSSDTIFEDSVFRGCSRLCEVSLPNGIKTIPDNAFTSCVSLKSINIPDTVTTIGTKAFFGCDSLESVALSSGLKSLGNAAFKGCYALTSVALPEGLETVPVEAFASCSNLETVSLPQSIKTIDSMAFRYCSELKTVNLPDSVEYINDEAFRDCRVLTAIALPKSLRNLKDMAFYGCFNLENISFSGNSASIGNDCFGDTAYFENEENRQDGALYIGNYLIKVFETGSKFTVKNGTVAIAAYAFKNMENLQELVVPEGVISIGNYCFENCTKLSKISLPDSLESFSSDAFLTTAYFTTKDNWENNEYLGILYIGKHLVYAIGAKELNIKEGTLNAEKDTFVYSTQLEAVKFPASFKTIPERMFGNCESLKTIASENGDYKFVDNCFINTKTKTLIAALKGAVIPDDGSVARIGDNAFGSFSGADTVCLPDSVTEVGADAFNHCYDLEKLVLGENITAIADDAINDTIVCFAKSGSYAAKRALENGNIVNCGTPTKPDSKYVALKNGVRYDYDGGKLTVSGVGSFYSLTQLSDNVTEIAVTDARVWVDGISVYEYINLKDISFPFNTMTIPNLSSFTNLTLHCDCGSYAEYYAAKNEILCDVTHTAKTVANKKSATCTAKGYTGDTICNNCDSVLSKGKTIAAKGHKTTNKVTKATPTANGKLAAVCSTCKKTVKTTTLYKVSSFKLSATKYTYDGKVKTPSVTVKDYKGKTLKNGKDYTVSYTSGRKNVGKYTVKLTLKGNYSGSKSLSFTVVPKSTKIKYVSAGKKKLTVKWSKQTSQTTGYQIQYSTSKSFSKAKTVTVTKNKTTSKTISKLKGKKTYYVRVRTYKTVGKTKYYSDWSKAVSKKTKK